MLWDKFSSSNSLVYLNLFLRMGDTSKWYISIDSLKDYFDVTNSYVLQKLRIILFPVTIKVSWVSFDCHYRVMIGNAKLLAMTSTTKSLLQEGMFKLLIYTFLWCHLLHLFWLLGSTLDQFQSKSFLIKVYCL